MVASIKIRIILDVIGEPFKLLAVLLLRIACYGTSLSSGASIAGRFWALLLSLLSAALGIGLIAFINLRLITAVDTSLRVLPEFLGLLGLLMAVTTGSQLALTTLGHHFVYRLRGEFVKRILDTQIEQVEKIGSASLLAGLTSDIRNITIAFVRLPELVQGIILTFGSAAYLAAVRKNDAGDGAVDGAHHLGRLCAGLAGVQTYGQPARNGR